MLAAEIPVEVAGPDALGLALARQLAVADRYHGEAVEWLKAGGWSVDPPPADQARWAGHATRRPV